MGRSTSLNSSCQGGGSQPFHQRKGMGSALLESGLGSSQLVPNPDDRNLQGTSDEHVKWKTQQQGVRIKYVVFDL